MTVSPDITSVRPMALLNPLAVLSDSFTGSILSRFGHEEGAYPFFTLIFAEDGGESDAPSEPEYYINVNLTQKFSAAQSFASTALEKRFYSVIKRARDIADTAVRLSSVALTGGGSAANTAGVAGVFSAARAVGGAVYPRLAAALGRGRGRAVGPLSGAGGFVSLSGGDVGAVYGLLRLMRGQTGSGSGSGNGAPSVLSLTGPADGFARELAEKLVFGIGGTESPIIRERVTEALRGIADGELILRRESSVSHEHIRDAVERIELVESAGEQERIRTQDQLERVTERLGTVEKSSADAGAVSREQIGQVVERIEGAETAEAAERVISRKRLRQVVERLEAAEHAENAESIISRERIRQVIERLENVESNADKEDAISRERVRQVIERLENADNEQRRESIVTRERIRQVIERLETAAEGEHQESSLAKTRIEEVIENIGGEEADRTRREYRDRQARTSKPWYAPFTLALSKAFSRELLRDRTGAVRGDAESLEKTVTPVMRERYRALTKSFTDELLSRGRPYPDKGSSVFNLLFRENAPGETRSETNNIFNIFNRNLSSLSATGVAAAEGGELSYAFQPRTGGLPPSTSTATVSVGADGADGLMALPVWARDFIRESAAGQGEPSYGASAARDMTAMEDIASAAGKRAGGTPDGGTVIWTAPYAAGPQAPTELKRAGGAETTKSAAPARLSEAEIQRMADRVYGIIESRVALERRRLGY